MTRMIYLESIGILLFTDLTPKVIPINRPNIFIDETGSLFFLTLNPLLETLKVNHTHGARAMTGNNQGVLRIIMVFPAKTAFNLIRVALEFIKVIQGLNLDSFFQLLLVQLLGTHLVKITSEILDPEPNSSQFNRVTFLNKVTVVHALD